MKVNLEDKLNEEMQYYCNYKCPYKDKVKQIEDDQWLECNNCKCEHYVSATFEVDYCGECQLKEFIMQIRDMRLEE